jgi:probable rRNA maturation factor
MSLPADSVSLSEPAAREAEPEPEPDSRLRLTATVVEEEGDWSGFGRVEQAVEAAAGALTRHPAGKAARGREASIVLAGDELVRGLNRSYRAKDAPTNVLSFPHQAPPGTPDAGKYLGDVVLAAETVRREAAECAIEPSHHLQHLVVHGLLHLLGYDHQTDSQAEAMERAETEILASLGIADPHAAPLA